MADLATIENVEAAWRPLAGVVRTRAEYYLGAASRRIRRRWKDVDERIAAQTLDAEDVSDVVVQMVLNAVDGPPVRGAKSFSEGTGPYSRSATLATTKTDPLEFEDWMIDVFEGSAATATPQGHFPPSGRYEHAFIWPEEC